VSLKAVVGNKMRASDPPQPTFSSTRRWTIMLNNILAVGAALALVVMVNYLASGYFKRSYWSRDASFELSNRTRNVLSSLTNDVTITIFFQPNGDNHEIYLLTTALLAEYQQANPRRVRVKTLDYTRSVGEAKELLSKYSLTALSDKDFVFFECSGHHKTVFARELVEYDFSDFWRNGANTSGAAVLRGRWYLPRTFTTSATRSR
jgi:hypothetical protein